MTMLLRLPSASRTANEVGVGNVAGGLARRSKPHTVGVACGHPLAVGLGIYTIARRLELDPKTVRRYADVAEANDLLHPDRMFRVSVLDRFKAHLQRRCTEGETGTTTLLAEIRALGYRGGSRTLRRWLAGVRGPEAEPIAAPAAPSTRDATGLIMRPGKDLTDDERATLDQLCQRHEPLATVRDLAHRFTN